MSATNRPIVPVARPIPPDPLAARPSDGASERLALLELREARAAARRGATGLRVPTILANLEAGLADIAHALRGDQPTVAESPAKPIDILDEIEQLAIELNPWCEAANVDTEWVCPDRDDAYYLARAYPRDRDTMCDPYEAEGDTRREALENLRASLQQALAGRAAMKRAAEGR